MTAGFLHGRSFLTTIIVKFKVRFSMFAYAKFSKYFFSQPKQSNSKAILQFFLVSMNQAMSTNLRSHVIVKQTLTQNTG